MMKRKKWSLQATITVLVCGVVALSLLVTDLLITKTIATSIEKYQEEKATNVARIVAHSQLVTEALGKQKHEGSIQEFAEETRRLTDVQFVVVMDMNGTRKSHPNPEKIGKQFIGEGKEVALKGKEHVSISKGTLGISLRSLTPIFDRTGKQLGVVAVGISLNDVEKAVSQGRENIYVGTLLGIVAGIFGAVILARYIRRILFGLEPSTIAKLLQERDAILQSVREGIIAVDQESRITLVNKAASRLFQKAGLTQEPQGMKMEEYLSNSKLGPIMETGKTEPNEELVLNGITLVVNRVPVFLNDKIVGAVSTFRDKTEIQQLAEQLTGVRLYAEALRAQSHEFMNKLHVILGMSHMGYYDQMTNYIKELVNHRNNEIGAISRNIKDPVLAGFLIGKLSYAREAGAELHISSDRQVPEPLHSHLSHELITILGNLIDNALESVSTCPRRQIEVHFDYGDDILTIEVKDNGVGIKKETLNHMFERGFSTKGEDRGVGLFLVSQSLERLSGEIEISSKLSQGTKFVVYIPYDCKVILE
ncbi:MAG: DcuS/MalK family sensor histidine kinase [Bacillota bacterium]